MIKEGPHAILIESYIELPCKKLITNYFPDCKTIQSGTSLEIIFQYIQEQCVDLVFIDLSIVNAYQLLDQLSKFQIYLILLGTHQQYSKISIKQTYHQFISDPHDLEKINTTIFQVTQHINISQLHEKLNRLTNTVSHLNELTFSISSKEGHVTINIIDILRIEAARSYCIVHHYNGNKVIVSKPLNSLEKKLPARMFVRIHASHLINICAIKRLIKSDGHTIVLDNGQQFPVASRRKEHLLNFFNSIS